MPWGRDPKTGIIEWRVPNPVYCYCCQATAEHCYCSFHRDDDGSGCGLCMKHNAVTVERPEIMPNGDTLIRRVKEHVCRIVPR